MDSGVDMSASVDEPPSPPVPDPNPVPQPDPVFVPVVGDQMDWRPSTENTQNDSQPHIPSEDSTPPPARQDPPAEPVHADEEHAYWAEFEEDLSTPSETELKEIVSSEDSCYSARKCMFSYHGEGQNRS